MDSTEAVRDGVPHLLSSSGWALLVLFHLPLNKGVILRGFG
jgi:hypothetical protein